MLSSLVILFFMVYWGAVVSIQPVSVLPSQFCRLQDQKQGYYLYGVYNSNLIPGPSLVTLFNVICQNYTDFSITVTIDYNFHEQHTTQIWESANKAWINWTVTGSATNPSSWENILFTNISYPQQNQTTTLYGFGNVQAEVFIFLVNTYGAVYNINQTIVNVISDTLNVLGFELTSTNFVVTWQWKESDTSLEESMTEHSGNPKTETTKKEFNPKYIHNDQAKEHLPKSEDHLIQLPETIMGDYELNPETKKNWATI